MTVQNTWKVKQEATKNTYVNKMVSSGKWKSVIVPPKITGMPRDLEIFLAKRKTNLITWDMYGDSETFCPATWADINIVSGSCGYQCKRC